MLAEFELPGIQRIGTVEDRALVPIPVPGLDGSYHQDLGSASIRIRIEGTLAGDEARDDFLTQVRGLFGAGEPIDFVADITTATEIEQVLLSDVVVDEVAGSPDGFRYALVLAQYVPPPPPPADPGGPGDLAAEAAGLFDAMQVPDLLGSVPELKDPTPPLSGTIDGVKSALGGLDGAGAAIGDLFGTP
jgi:hypothetical protein